MGDSSVSSPRHRPLCQAVHPDHPRIDRSLVVAVVVVVVLRCVLLFCLSVLINRMYEGFLGVVDVLAVDYGSVGSPWKS